MIKRLKILISIIIISICSFSYAGGPSWKTKVIKYDQLSETSAIVGLRATGKIYNGFQACNPLTVHIDYRRESWFQRKTWSKYTTKDKHKEALNILRSAWKSDEELEFGYIGGGLVPVNSNDKCEVKVKAIMPLQNKGVVAFHDPV